MQRGEGISAFMYVNGRTDREAERERERDRGRLPVLSHSLILFTAYSNSLTETPEMFHVTSCERH